MLLVLRPQPYEKLHFTGNSLILPDTSNLFRFYPDSATCIVLTYYITINLFHANLLHYETTGGIQTYNRKL